MSRKLTIRRARPGDSAAMLQVHREAILAKAATHYDQATMDAWGVGVTPERVARGERQIADPTLLILVAEADGEILGYAMAAPSREQLRALYVKPNKVGRVGTALLGELERIAFQTAGALACDAALNAVEFYRSHGYVELGKVDHVLSSGVRVLSMQMRKVRPGT